MPFFHWFNSSPCAQPFLWNKFDVHDKLRRANKTHFFMKGCAPGLVLKYRYIEKDISETTYLLLARALMFSPGILGSPEFQGQFPSSLSPLDNQGRGGLESEQHSQKTKAMLKFAQASSSFNSKSITVIVINRTHDRMYNV